MNTTNSFMKTNTAKVNQIIVGILWLAFLTSGILLIFNQQRPEVFGSLFVELLFST